MQPLTDIETSAHTLPDRMSHHQHRDQGEDHARLAGGEERRQRGRGRRFVAQKEGDQSLRVEQHQTEGRGEKMARRQFHRDIEAIK